jgi:hypothetical protein
MLCIVTQIDQRHHLTGDVTVLTPPRNLVVPELGIDREERRALRVLVDLRLPAHGRRCAHGLGAVDERQGAPDTPGDRLGIASGCHQPVTPARQLLDRQVDPTGCAREQTDLFEHDQGWYRHRPHGTPRLRDRHRDSDDGRSPLLGKPPELSPTTYGDE